MKRKTKYLIAALLVCLVVVVASVPVFACNGAGNVAEAVKAPGKRLPGKSRPL